VADVLFPALHGTHALFHPSACDLCAALGLGFVCLRVCVWPVCACLLQEEAQKRQAKEQEAYQLALAQAKARAEERRAKLKQDQQSDTAAQAIFLHPRHCWAAPDPRACSRLGMGGWQRNSAGLGADPCRCC
jgi:hypothetical protein